MKETESIDLARQAENKQDGSAVPLSFQPQVPWWKSTSGMVLIAVYILMVLASVMVQSRAYQSELMNVNGLEVFRDVETARMDIRHDEARESALEALESFLGTSLDGRYHMYARPWSSDSRQRYFALFDNSIDSFNRLRGLYILREGWRVDFREPGKRGYDWSVWLNSRGWLLGLQYNGVLPSGVVTSQDYARALVQRVLANSVFADVPTLQELDVRQLVGGWSFSYTDSADYKLIKGWPMLRVDVMGDRISRFSFGLSIPDADSARLDKGYQENRKVRWMALGVIGAIFLWLLIFLIHKAVRGEMRGSGFWKLCLVCVSFMLIYILNRHEYLNLWLAGQDLPRVESLWLIPVALAFALLTALLASWTHKWVETREIKADFMPMLGTQIPLLLFLALLAGFSSSIVHRRMGPVHTFPGPSQIFPLYGNLLVNSCVLFVIYLFAQGLMAIAISRYEKLASRRMARLLYILVSYLVTISVSFLLVAPLRLPPYNLYALRLACLFLPVMLSTVLLFLYPLRMRYWYLSTLLWMLAPVISELISPSYREGGLPALLVWALIGFYALLLQLGLKRGRPFASPES